MRARIFTAAAILLLVVTAVAAIAPSSADDANDQRISDLETRVAALETRVAATPPAGTGQDGQDGEDGQNGQPGQDGKDGEDGASGSTSTSSSSQSSDGVFTGVYSGTGDGEIDLEIDNPGTYHLTVNASSPLSVAIETDDGEPVPGFAINGSETGTVERTARLEPGNYVLRVAASSTWTVTLVLFGD